MIAKLYDLAGRDGLRFSPYCTRVKMALALKGLPYETVPTRFTEIGRIGHGSFKTVPVLDLGGTLIGDSFLIAEHLEAAYPARPIFAGGAAGIAAARFIEGMMFNLVHTVAMHIIVFDIHEALDPADKAYFRASREARLGRTLEEVHADREARIADLRRQLLPHVHTLKHHPFLGGSEAMFVDAIAFGSLAWMQAFGTLDIVSHDRHLADWYARCREIVGS